MEKDLVLCDTNIFIHWFNNDKATIEKLQLIGLSNIAISVISVMELIAGVDNKQQLNHLKKKIKNYYIVDFDKEVSKLSLLLIEKFKLSENLQIPDAIIGATAITLNMKLLTYNKKDFRFMPKIKLLDL
ncbi:MAG: type II toxin-antitoxin system VapC family toxin [Bacteroidales bacterium]|nr:type II toxin-antitoxin system VapC family toxin [Bacteroidales bacterium]